MFASESGMVCSATNHRPRIKDANMPLRETLANTWSHIQDHLFPWLRAEAGPLTGPHQRLVVVLEMARIERFVPVSSPGLAGRPTDDRHALARAFTAKAVLGLPTTAALIERLAVDQTLRRLCGCFDDQ